MKEECVVCKIKGGVAYISLVMKEKCGGCKACSFGRSKKISLPAIMDVACCVGDKVLVQMPEKETSLSLFLFFIPLLFFAVGFTVGGFVAGGGDLVRIIAAFAFCAVSFAVVLMLERHFRLRREHMPIIIKVIDKP